MKYNKKIAFNYLFGQKSLRPKKTQKTDSPENNQKSVREMTPENGGSREFRGVPGLAELGPRRSNYQRGLDIKKAIYSRIRIFGDLVIRILELYSVIRILGRMFCTLTRWVGG